MTTYKNPPAGNPGGPEGDATNVTANGAVPGAVIGSLQGGEFTQSVEVITSNHVAMADVIDWSEHRRYKVAQACARMGWCVMPWRSPGGAKRPCLKGWQKRATTDPEVIEQWWGLPGDIESVGDAEVGILTGECSCLWVLDVDTHGADGFRTLADLESLYEPLPATFTVRTPSGGEHRYFRYPKDGRDIWTKAGTIGPGLDTRGWHGFVAAPYSGIRPYTVLADVPVATAPRWLEDLAEKKRGQKEPTSYAPGPVRTDFYAWIEQAGSVTTGQEWFLFTGLCRMQHAGLLDDHMKMLGWEAARRFPELKSEWPWTSDDVSNKVRHVTERYPKGARR